MRLTFGFANGLSGRVCWLCFQRINKRFRTCCPNIHYEISPRSLRMSFLLWSGDVDRQLAKVTRAFCVVVHQDLCLIIEKFPCDGVEADSQLLQRVRHFCSSSKVAAGDGELQLFAIRCTL
jgi:hypothetical protein